MADRNGLDGQPESSRRRQNFRRAGSVGRRQPIRQRVGTLRRTARSSPRGPAGPKRERGAEPKGSASRPGRTPWRGESSGEQRARGGLNSRRGMSGLSGGKKALQSGFRSNRAWRKRRAALRRRPTGKRARRQGDLVAAHRRGKSSGGRTPRALRVETPGRLGEPEVGEAVETAGRRAGAEVVPPLRKRRAPRVERAEGEETSGKAGWAQGPVRGRAISGRDLVL